MTEKKLIRKKVSKWFDSQICELEKDERQNIAKMLGDWVLIEKKAEDYEYLIKIAKNALKSQKQRTEEKFIREGWTCGPDSIFGSDYFPFHAEETDYFLGLCWVRHIVKTPEKIMEEMRG